MLLKTVDAATRLNEPSAQKGTQTPLIILDAGVDNLSSLLADLPNNARAVVLDPTKDGIEQITAILAAHQSVSSLHLVSHGKPGQLHLGNIALSTATLNHYDSQLRQWATALKGADLLVYGCQVGEGVFGTFFLQQLQQLTGANIAASDKRVGLVDGTPNWTLDTQLGNVQTDVIFSEELQQNYQGSFVEVSFDIEQDVAIETEGTLVTFRFTLDEAPPPEGTVVVLSANETSSINRFDPGFGGSNLQLNGIDPFLPNNDISPGFIFDAFALNITQQNASFSIPLFNTPNDVSVDNPNTNPAIEDAADVAEEITWSISTIAPGDAANLGLGTPGTVSAGASSDTITIADNPDQLSPSVPEVSITSDITELVEDEGTVVTFTISASEAPPSGGINITLDTAKTLGLADFDVFASSFAGDLGFVTAPPGNESLVLRLSGLSGSVSVPIFDDQDRTEDGTQSDPNGPLRNDDIGEEQTTFTLLEGDGYTVSPTAASVTLTLKDTNVVNTAPVATDDSFTVEEDTVLTGDVSGNDTDTEDDASYALDADAANGTVALADDGSFTYTPDADFNGTDSFTYTLSDAEFSSTATVNITVNDVVDNTAPVATDDSFTVEEDTVLTGDVSENDTDTEGGASYALDADAANGTVALADDGSFTYTPDADFNGTDSFTYTLSDAEFSSTATVNIMVNDVVDNTAPVATDDSFTVEEDTVLTGDVSGNDTDAEGDASYALDADAANGTVALADDGSFTYTPDADFNGTDSFTYTLSDAEFSSTATVNITVNDVVDNIAPVAVNDSFSTDEDTSVSGDVSTNDSDPNGDALTYSVTGDVSNGTLNFNADGSFDYTPDADFNGTDSFTYEVSDGELTSTATAEISIAPVNDIPVVSFSTTSGTLSEAAGDELVLNFAVDGDIPPEGITVNLEGDTAEILQQFLAPDGDGAVQTR
ncbi:MAG: Ig-like domain-containing protein, partial [Cyanobacteria bacterium J06650_10]